MVVVRFETGYFNMNYGQFITEIQKYWDLRKRGLKKQANSFLFEFTKCFKEDVSDIDADAILFQFCKEYIDEMKFPGDNLPRRHLPFQITELLNSYLYREREKNKMPQMRWAFQIFGESYNPHDSKSEHNPHHILKRAYEYYVKLYDIYFDWWENGRNGDFYELCKKEGLDFKEVPVFYYKKCKPSGDND